MRRVLKYAIGVIVSYTTFFVVSNLYTQNDRTLQMRDEEKTHSWPVRPRPAKLTSSFLNKAQVFNNEKLMKLYMESGFFKPPVTQLNKELQAKLKHYIQDGSNKTSFDDSVHSYSPNPACSADFNPNLEWAPPVFYPKGVGVTRLKKPDCKLEDRLWKNNCCRTVYFLGGGKCGSTSLALLLKHNISNLDYFDPRSGFADGGKEPCWALASGGEKELYNKFHDCSTSCNPSKQSKTVVLDACPRYSKSTSARKIVCSNPDAKFVMLVRDPLLRTISDHNDYLIRGAGRTRKLSLRDKQTLSMRSMALSDYYTILKNFLQYVPPQNVLVVQTEFLQQQNYVQHIMNEVQNHFGVPNREVRAVMSNVNSADPKYTLPSKSSFESTLSKLCSKSIAFFNLVGYKFDWLLSKSDIRASQHFSPKY